MTASITAIVDAPIKDVWAIISDFAHLDRWHPDVVGVVSEGAGEGATRKVSFADWWATERLDRLDDDNFVVGYSVIDSSRPPAIGVSGTISLTEADVARTCIKWESGQRPDHPMAAQINTGLEAYYPTRIGHLRSALGLAP